VTVHWRTATSQLHIQQLLKGLHCSGASHRAACGRQWQRHRQTVGTGEGELRLSVFQWNWRRSSLDDLRRADVDCCDEVHRPRVLELHTIRHVTQRRLIEPLVMCLRDKMDKTSRHRDAAGAFRRRCATASRIRIRNDF